MKILFLISGHQVPSSRFRVLQYVPHLRALGHQCVVAPSIPPKYQGLPLVGNRLSEIPRAFFRLCDCCRAWWSRYDVIVLERELFSSDFWLLERLFRKLAPAMVLDVDDGIFLQHPKKFAALATLCDAVIVGSRLLHDQAAPLNPRTTVIPTSLDLTRYTQKQFPNESSKSPVIGWTGMADNLRYLHRVTEALRQLARRHDFQLQIIAERELPAGLLDLRDVDVRFVPWNKQTEIADLQQFDIGLMPLDDNQWTRYKCGLKILQYMAIGIPGIASPVGVNSQIIQHGENGFLAETPRQWAESLAALLPDVDLRRRIGAAGRRTVEQSYCVEVNLPRLEQTLATAAGSPA